MYSHIIQVIQHNTTSFQQKLMQGIKQNGSKIRPKVSLGLIFDPHCKGHLRLTYFLRKYLILFMNFWSTLYIFIHIQLGCVIHGHDDYFYLIKNSNNKQQSTSFQGFIIVIKMGSVVGAFVKIQPTYAWVPQRLWRITLQQPRSSISNPNLRYRSSVSYSVPFVCGPRYWK